MAASIFTAQLLCDRRENPDSATRVKERERPKPDLGHGVNRCGAASPDRTFAAAASLFPGISNNGGRHVNHKRVERIWRREGLKVPQRQPRKGQLWLK